MKTIFDADTRQEILVRIAKLKPESVPLWGKMSVYQMIIHCRKWEEMVRAPNMKRVLVGKLFGSFALKKVLKDEKPLGKGSPTSPVLMTKEQMGDIELEKSKWIDLLNSFENYHRDDYEHVFFGKMTNTQIGQLDYKHIDHHLRQFGV